MRDETDVAAPGGIATRGLAAGGLRRLLTLLGRAFRRRCPYCGGSGVFRGWFELRDTCPTCGVSFSREEGYFLGAMLVNLLVAEGLAVGAVIALMVFSDLSLLPLEVVGIGLAVGLPILFYPYSRLLWMAIDLQLDPPEKQTQRQLRADQIGR